MAESNLFKQEIFDKPIYVPRIQIQLRVFVVSANRF